MYHEINAHNEWSHDADIDQEVYKFLLAKAILKLGELNYSTGLSSERKLLYR